MYGVDYKLKYMISHIYVTKLCQVQFKYCFQGLTAC